MPDLRRVPRYATVAIAFLATAGCAKGPAYGSENAVIAIVHPALLERLEPVIRESFEREVFTTRTERVLEVTFTTPTEVGSLRLWKRLLIVEPLSDAVLVPELVDVPEEGPAAGEIHDAWATDQTIHVLAGSTPAATVDLVTARIDSLYGVVLGRFVAHQVERMWASGRDSALAGRLMDSLGFSLVLPKVYRPAPESAPPDSRTWYNEDPRRVVSLHWLPGPATLAPDIVLAARRAWGRRIFPGDSISAAVSASETTLNNLPAVRIQGIWQDREDISAGLFLTYGVLCGDRLVILDGNLYAPDRDKYPFLVQFERILGTFRCDEGSA